MLRDCSAKVQNKAMLDWNDIRYFLAVAESGSTLAAGRALRVSQTTAARRVAALEAALGVTLFERRQAGYALTPEGEALLARARDVKAAADGFADAAAAQGRAISGTVRLTTHEIFAVTLLMPILRDLHAAFPAIRVELDTAEELRDLAGGAADIALRSTHQPDGGGLFGRRLCADDWTLYCSRAYAEEHGVPANRHQLRQHSLIGGGGEQVWRPYREWLKRNDLEDAVAMHHSSAIGLLTAVRGGLGLAVLPRFAAFHDPDLIQCLPPAPNNPRSMWLLTHERVRHTPRVRAVIDFLAERLLPLARALDD